MPTPDYILELRRTHGQGRLFLPGVSAVVVRELAGDAVPEVLLTRRTDTGQWALPSGIVEPGEQPATTIERELWEETRVVAHAERLALMTVDPEQTYPNGDVCQFVSMTFRCRYVSGEAAVGDEESIEVAWFGVDALPAELDERQRRRIACGLERSGAVRLRPLRPDPSARRRSVSRSAAPKPATSRPTPTTTGAAARRVDTRCS